MTPAATGANYAITPVNGTFTINRATLTITANSCSKTYGTVKTFAATAFSQTGLVNGDTIAGVTETSIGAAASALVSPPTYSIVASAATGTGLSNYTVSDVARTLTVNKAALTRQNDGIGSKGTVRCGNEGGARQLRAVEIRGKGNNQNGLEQPGQRVALPRR